MDTGETVKSDLLAMRSREQGGAEFLFGFVDVDVVVVMPGSMPELGKVDFGCSSSGEASFGGEALLRERRVDNSGTMEWRRENCSEVWVAD